jgi:ABC-type Mn2+/Zn2+ transport system permease subunit
MVLVALTVVVSFQTVGTLLVMAMLLAPAGTGALLARRLPGMIAVAVACGSASVVGGLLASWYLNLAASASIALFGVVLFFAALSAANLLRRHRAGSA